MSVIFFKLKEEHIKLLKNLRWSMKDNIITNTYNDGEETAPPFGENNIYEAIDLILNGNKNNTDPFVQEEFVEYTDEQKAEWDNLYAELPTALDVILYNGHFELGLYKTRYHLRAWAKTI